MKICTQCKEAKDVTEFYKDRRQSDGLRCNCKSCQNIKRNDWRKRNPEKVKKSLKKYYQNHKQLWKDRDSKMSDEEREKKRLKSKEYFEKNKDLILQKRKQKYATISDGFKKRYNQKYYHENKEEICNRSRENYKNLSCDQKKANTERTKIWRQKNRQKMRAWSALGNALIRGEMKKPNFCEKCSEKNERLHGHHEDYNKPLEVIWLCHSCHMNLHREERLI